MISQEIFEIEPAELPAFEGRLFTCLDFCETGSSDCEPAASDCSQ
jgi:hypothetical protein